MVWWGKLGRNGRCVSETNFVMIPGVIILDGEECEGHEGRTDIYLYILCPILDLSVCIYFILFCPVTLQSTSILSHPLSFCLSQFMWFVSLLAAILFVFCC